MWFYEVLNVSTASTTVKNISAKFEESTQWNIVSAISRRYGIPILGIMKKRAPLKGRSIMHIGYNYICIFENKPGAI